MEWRSPPRACFKKKRTHVSIVASRQVLQTRFTLGTPFIKLKNKSRVHSCRAFLFFCNLLNMSPHVVMCTGKINLILCETQCTQDECFWLCTFIHTVHTYMYTHSST